MARPRLGEEERRGRTVGVRVTEAEAEELQERAQAARLSMGAYLRRRGLGAASADGSGAAAGRGGAAGAEPDRGESQSNGAGDERGSGGGARDPGGGRAGRRAGGGVAGRGGRVMVTKMSASGRSFGGVADYCLHDRWVPGAGASGERKAGGMDGDPQPGHRAGGSGGADHGRHSRGGPGAETPGRCGGDRAKAGEAGVPLLAELGQGGEADRQEMLRAAEASLKALGMERHQALIVSHRDGQPHVHVIANRVDPESGKAAGLSRSKLRLSKWAERYEREQGKIRCPARERNNKRREAGERVVDGRGHSGGRFRRERMSPQREPREAIPAEREGPERERVAWQRGEERMHWERIQQWRRKDLGKLERRSKWEWSELYGVKSGSGSSWRKTAVGC